jgi:3-hydroxybutyryl-CoA dehydrogenase
MHVFYPRTVREQELERMPQAGQSVAVIGGGTMGADIAAGFAACGWTAHIVNPPDRMRGTLPARIAAAMEKLGAPYREADFPVHEALATLPWRAVGIVIEAAPERLDVKRRIFAELERLANPDAPLCSNSSAIPIGRIGEGLKTQRRMVGTHYFMPAHLVPAVEVVCSKHTDRAIADRVSEVLASVGKVPVRVNLDIPGFLANRIQHALAREAISLVERGIASPEDVDNAVRYGFGFRYIAAGPLMQRDHAGLDVHCAAAETIYPDLCNGATPSPYMSEKVKAGHVGMKAGRGFYEWTAESIAKEKARYEAALTGAMEILRREQAKARTG